MNGYRGYIGSNLAFSRSVPQHIQQQIIRDYCQRNNLKFLLSATEYHEGSMMLESLLESDIEGIVFYSIGLLPKDRKARQRLYNSRKDIRFAAENIHKMNKPLFETAFIIDDYHAGSQFRYTVAYCKQAQLPRAHVG